MTEYAIRTQDLSRHFGSVIALDRLTLDVPRGAVFGFLGSNGSGKTTTIHLLLGLLAPTAGEGEVLGYDIVREGAQIRARSGALLEHHGLYERMSALENLEFYARVTRLDRRERGKRIKQLLTHLGLWERRREVVGGWSRGMKQKLAVARALLHRPPLIFLDEPTDGLDPVASAALRQDLIDLAAENGVTIFLTTHNLAEAEKLCSQVGVIRDGRLLAVGAPRDLQAQRNQRTIFVRGSGFSDEMAAQLRFQPSVEQIHLRARNGIPHVTQELRLHTQKEARISDLVSYLVHAGARVEEVQTESANLEEVFLDLVNTPREEEGS